MHGLGAEIGSSLIAALCEKLRRALGANLLVDLKSAFVIYKALCSFLAKIFKISIKAIAYSPLPPFSDILMIRAQTGAALWIVGIWTTWQPKSQFPDSSSF